MTSEDQSKQEARKGREGGKKKKGDMRKNWKQKEGVGAGWRERRRAKAKGPRRGEEANRRGEGEENVRSQEGRAWLRASHPSCELRGINGPQLARLSAVFLAFPEEGEQSVCAGCGASATQRVRPRSWLSGPLLAPD